jgi:Amidohydrolase/AMP-binding enzyme
MGCAAMSGARVVLMERFEAERCLQLIQEQGITLLYTVPQVLAVLSEWPRLKEYDLHTVRFAQACAAPVAPALARRFEERTHITVMTSYGLTEASPGTHSNPVYDPRLIKVETIGLPIHDTKQKIVDIETGERELDVGEEGELIVQGSGHSGIGTGMRGGGGVHLKYGNPMYLDDVAVDFPDMPIIMAHPSFPWQDEALSVCLHKPQVYIDLSGWSPKYFPPQLIQYANTQLKHKMLFGSDYPLITPDRWLADFEKINIRPEVRPLILKENAIKLLGLDSSSSSSEARA